MILGQLVTSEAAARLKTGMLKYCNIFVSQYQIRFFLTNIKVNGPNGFQKYMTTKKTIRSVVNDHEHLSGRSYSQVDGHLWNQIHQYIKTIHFHPKWPSSFLSSYSTLCSNICSVSVHMTAHVWLWLSAIFVDRLFQPWLIVDFDPQWTFKFTYESWPYIFDMTHFHIFWAKYYWNLIRNSLHYNLSNFS